MFTQMLSRQEIDQLKTAVSNFKKYQNRDGNAPVPMLDMITVINLMKTVMWALSNPETYSKSENRSDVIHEVGQLMVNAITGNINYEKLVERAENNYQYLMDWMSRK